jgi:hypothetical protein
VANGGEDTGPPRRRRSWPPSAPERSSRFGCMPNARGWPLDRIETRVTRDPGEGKINSIDSSYSSGRPHGRATSTADRDRGAVSGPPDPDGRRDDHPALAASRAPPATAFLRSLRVYPTVTATQVVVRVTPSMMPMASVTRLADGVEGLALDHRDEVVGAGDGVHRRHAGPHRSSPWRASSAPAWSCRRQSRSARRAFMAPLLGFPSREQNATATAPMPAAAGQKFVRKDREGRRRASGRATGAGARREGPPT